MSHVQHEVQETYTMSHVQHEVQETYTLILLFAEACLEGGPVGWETETFKTFPY